MPKINRIRICNVCYDDKYIIDELFDTYDGENMLLNLANGSGKSVLVQLMLQPILPCIKIHDRNIDYYLSENKSPTYIMLEWKLDNTAHSTYFMTGIVMCKVFANDQSSARVKYFTFTNYYGSANQYDIKNIPFIQKNNKETLYQSYDAALKSIRQLTGTSSKIKVYTKEEEKEHKIHLSEHGIFTDEWNIIAKINEKEGGVDELFDKCKSSDSLINQWILKIITESTNGNNELQEMFSELMLSIVEQDDNIKQKEVLDNFKSAVDNYLKPLTELLSGISNAQEIEKKLAQIYYYYQNKYAQLKFELDRLEERYSETKNELNNIQYEKISEDYYNKEEDYQRLSESLESANEFLLKAKEEFDKNKLLKETYEAAEIYTSITAAENEISIQNDALRRINERNHDEHTKNVVYSLFIRYSEAIEQIHKNINEIEDEFNKLANEIEEKNSQIKNERNLRDKIIETRTSLNHSVENFKRYEKDVFQELDIFINRNMFSELVENETENTKKNYLKLQDDYNAEIDRLSKTMIVNEQSIKISNEENENILQNVIQKNKELSEVNNEIKNYYEKEEQLRLALDAAGFLFEKPFNLEQKEIELRHKKIEIQSRLNKITTEIDRQKEFLNALKKGGVHTAPQLAGVFRKYGIEFSTGEAYLKEQENSIQEKLIKLNPLLPYCYLISKADMTKLENLQIDEEINKVSPIMAFEDIETDFNSMNKIVNVNSVAKLACFYNRQCFDYELKDKYEENLNTELDQNEKKYNSYREELSNLEFAIMTVMSFNFEKNYLEKLEKNGQDITKQIDELKAKISENSFKLQKLQDENETISKEIQNVRAKLEKTRVESSRFLQYLSENEIYLKNLSCEREWNDNLTETDKKIEMLIDRINKAIDSKNEKERVKDNLEKQNNHLIVNKNMLSSYENGTLLEENFETLVRIYEDIKSNYSRSIDDINKIIDIKTKEKLNNEKKLKKYFLHVDKEQYASIEYDESIYDVLSYNYSKAQKIYEQKKDEANKMERDRAVGEERFNGIKNELNKFGKSEPLPRYEIKRNYQMREVEITQRQREIESGKIRVEGLKKTYDDKQILIIRKIDVGKFSNLNIKIDADFDSIDINTLINNFEKQNRDNDKQRREINKLYNDIKNEYKGKHQVINNFITNMEANETEDGFDDYYYVFERITDCNVRLVDFLSVINNALQTVEDDKNNIIRHAITQGRILYSEMKKITESSYVKLPDRKTPQQMLKINIPKELDVAVEERISAHIKYCIAELRKGYLLQDDIKKFVRQKTNVLLSDRQLLDLTIDKSSLEVKLIKIDITSQKSELRTWEEVIVGNSGGQKFVSCFVLISALIDYTRKKALEAKGETKLAGSKTFIIDNPFGKTSSKHLLDAMVSIANKFDTQMICLSDLSQSSITNKFALIYQLSLRLAMYSNKAFLKIDDIKIDSNIYKNERLEHACVRSEQISFFE